MWLLWAHVRDVAARLSGFSRVLRLRVRHVAARLSGLSRVLRLRVRHVAARFSGFSRVLRLRVAALQDIYAVIGRAVPGCRGPPLLPWQRPPAAGAVTERLRLMARALPACGTRLGPEMLKLPVSDSLRTRWPALGRLGDFMPRDQVTAMRHAGSFFSSRSFI